MSRSLRKTPRFKFANDISNKADRAKSNRKCRRLTNIKLKQASVYDIDFVNLPNVKDVSDPWDWAGDGKADIYDATAIGTKWMRK